MEINRRYQDRFIEGDAADRWVAVEEVERDICLMYHQLSAFYGVDETVCCGAIFNLPYWEYLDISDIPEEDRTFIRDGCLVMILGYCLARICGCMSWDGVNEAHAAVQRLQTKDAKERRLIDGVLMALEAAQHPRSKLYEQELAELSVWAHIEFVREYFRSKVRDFDFNPYFKM